MLINQGVSDGMQCTVSECLAQRTAWWPLGSIKSVTWMHTHFFFHILTLGSTPTSATCKHLKPIKLPVLTFPAWHPVGLTVSIPSYGHSGMTPQSPSSQNGFQLLTVPFMPMGPTSLCRWNWPRPLTFTRASLLSGLVPWILAMYWDNVHQGIRNAIFLWS